MSTRLADELEQAAACLSEDDMDPWEPPGLAARLRARAARIRAALVPFEDVTWTTPRLGELLAAIGPARD